MSGDRQPRPGDRDDWHKWVHTRQEVEARTATGEQVHARGKVVALADFPTLTIETETGERVHWAAHLTAAVPPRCRASEGCTGIECDLPKGHSIDLDHEGTHVPNESCDYPLFVRWPWQQYDQDYADVALPKGVDSKTLFPPPVGTAPRVFSSDGPEPPEDVTCLRYLDHEKTYPYLRRTEVGWLWAHATSTVLIKDGQEWSEAARPGRYEEVRP